MQRSASLGLRVPAALLPSSAGPEASDSLTPLGSESELSGELQGLNSRPALHELDRGFSDTAALRPPPAAASGLTSPAPSVRSAASGEPPRAGAHTQCGSNAVAQPPMLAERPSGADVQRMGSRRGPSQPGSATADATAPPNGASPASGSASSRGWPSTRGSSVCDMPGRAHTTARDLQAAPAPPPAAAAPRSSSTTPRSSTVGSRSPSPESCAYGGEEAAADGEGSSQWTTASPSSPGSSIGVARGPSVQTAAAAQARVPAAAARSLRPAPLPRSASPMPHSPASTRPSSRSSSRQGGYMGRTSAAEAKRGRPGSAGTLGSRPSSVAPSSRPGSASAKNPARPSSSRPGLEQRVGRQMTRDPADWTVSEVCDWLELIGLGQYRRRVVHNAVNGALLLKLSNEELKVEVGIRPIGHREGLLNAINDLEEYWQQRQQQAEEQRRLSGGAEGDDGQGYWGSPGSSHPGSPTAQLPGMGADYSLQRAFAQRAKLLRDLEKAEGRQAHRSMAAEQALRVVGQASDEVRKLQAAICDLDRQLGWQAATQQLCDPLDVHGAVAWQPAGKQRAGLLRPGSGSPCGGPRSSSPGRVGSPGGAGGSPMSRMSRRIMEAQSERGGGSFLDRLSRDIALRQAKTAEALRRSGRYVGNADEQLAEREREARDIAFIREMIESKNRGLSEMLASGEPAQVAEACDELAESYQADFQLSDDAVAAVKRVGTPGKKTSRLAGALRSAQFMQRLQQDLSMRDLRLKELQHKYFKLEKGNTMEQQERADLAAAQAHFLLLGWSAANLDVAAEDETAGTDAPLACLLRRVVALQEAQQRDKPAPDWEQPEWKRDGLGDLQRERNAELQKAVDAHQQAAAAAAAALAAGKRSCLLVQGMAKKDEPPKPADRLGETVELLAACRPAEVALLEGLAGYRKLMMCWRAVRAQQFIAFTRRDLEARKAKAAQLEAQLYPDKTKVLPKEEFEKFFDRLMADTQRRERNKDELVEKAKAEALAKLMKSAPHPLNHNRQRPASAAP